MGRFLWLSVVVVALVVLLAGCDLARPTDVFAVAWLRQFGTDASDGASGVAVDANGNAFVAGGTLGDLGGFTNAGSSDIFLAKYTPDGTRLWLRQFGSCAGDAASGVAVDASGNVFVTGATTGGLDGYTNAGDGDVYLVKYAPDGRRLWLRQFGSGTDEAGYGVAVDSSGNVVVAGYTLGGLGGFSNAGSQDVFLAKYAPDGTRLWLRQFGGGPNDVARGVAVDAGGNVLVAGYTASDLDGFTRAGGYDVFLAKYAPDGTRLWLREFGTDNDDGNHGVAVDGSGNAFVVGYTFGNFDGFTRAGGYDLFLAKYAPDGTRLWLRQFGSGEDELARGVAANDGGNVFVTGSTAGGMGGYANAGGSDVFLVEYAPDGTRLWVGQFGSGDDDQPYGVAVDGSGNVLVAGATFGDLDGFTNAGENDAFVAKYAR